MNRNAPSRRLALAGLSALALAAAVLPMRAQAQVSFNGPIRLLVGYAPGGPVDTAARQFAPALSRELGRAPEAASRVYFR